MKIIKVCSFVLVLVFSSISIVYLYFQNQFNENFNQKYIENVQTEIENQSDLPSLLYIQYEKLYPNDLNSNQINALLSQQKSCPCVLLARTIINESTIKGNSSQVEPVPFQFFLGEELEEIFTQKQCLSYTMKHFNFYNGVIGIEKASEYYFHKKLDKLKEDEIIILLKSMKKPRMLADRK